MFAAAKKDEQQITNSWQRVQPSIDGVAIREVLHVPRNHGIITELYRPEWDPSGLPVVQAYQSRLFPGAIGAWSCHARSIDRVFVNSGLLKVVLFDGRERSSTQGVLNEFYAGDARPMFLVIPTGIWHGLQNIGTTDALILNFPTVAYDYEDPDHYRLPLDAPEIPYVWTARTANVVTRGDENRR